MRSSIHFSNSERISLIRLYLYSLALLPIKSLQRVLFPRLSINSNQYGSPHSKCTQIAHILFLKTFKLYPTDSAPLILEVHYLNPVLSKSKMKIERVKEYIKSKRKGYTNSKQIFPIPSLAVLLSNKKYLPLYGLASLPSFRCIFSISGLHLQVSVC